MEKELDLLRRACSMKSKYFCLQWYFPVNLGTDNDLTWSSLVAKGMAEVTEEPNDWRPLRVYVVTDAGRRAFERERAVTVALDEYVAALDARREETT
jgi:hypothetical protein